MPVIGDALRLDPKRPVQREMEFVRELGDVFEINIVGSKLIVVGGGALRRRCSTSPDSPSRRASREQSARTCR